MSMKKFLSTLFEDKVDGNMADDVLVCVFREAGCLFSVSIETQDLPSIFLTVMPTAYTRELLRNFSPGD